MTPRKPYNVQVRQMAGRCIQLRYWDPRERKYVRKSSGTWDLREAKELAKQLEAELRIAGCVPDRHIPWSGFVRAYEQGHLSALDGDTQTKAHTVFRHVREILRPRSLADVAQPAALVFLRTRLLDGRSPFTVRSYMGQLMAALGWAEEVGYLPNRPRLPRMKLPKVRAKGRPITDREFGRMLRATRHVVRRSHHWRHVLWGLWLSGLRLGELMDMHWTDPLHIRPVWPESGYPVLEIPADKQKSPRDDCIPLLPSLELLLSKLPSRDGYVFQFPGTIVPRVTLIDASRVISQIGELAEVVVAPGKTASAHDLRRSCADRLLASRVDPRVVQRILRHTSLRITEDYYSGHDVQRDAEYLQQVLGKTKGAA